MTPRGGKREGAGRKTRPNSMRRNVYLSNEVYERLRRNGNASAEIERITAAYDALLIVAQKLIDYRVAAGALNFQLEKADDFIREMAAIAAAEGREG